MMPALRILIYAISLVIVNPSISLALFLGPYTGQVIDSQTGEPVEGASVLCYWTKLIPQIMHANSETITVKFAYTDKKGNYVIPQIFANLGLSAKLESTNLIIYQPGYKAYIVRIWHDSPFSEPDPSFKEKEDIVMLDRVPPDFSHKKHYEEMEGTLWGIDEYPYSGPRPQDNMTWKDILEINLRGFPEKEEFLRRIEWEERRGRVEEKR